MIRFRSPNHQSLVFSQQIQLYHYSIFSVNQLLWYVVWRKYFLNHDITFLFVPCKFSEATVDQIFKEIRQHWPIVGGDNGVLLALLDILPVPLADAGTAGVGQHNAAKLAHRVRQPVALNGGTDLLRARGDVEGAPAQYSGCHTTQIQPILKFNCRSTCAIRPESEKTSLRRRINLPDLTLH